MSEKAEGQSPRREKLNVTDFMTIGVFFVIITLVGTVVAFVGITPVTFVMISPMLLIMAVISGAFSLLMALGPYHLIIGSLLALIAEGILWSGKYGSVRAAVLAYAVTALATTANYIPLFFATQRYIADSDIAGKYSEGMAKGMTAIGEHGLVLFAVIVGVTFVTALLGGLLGQKVFNKHFKRAGIV